MRNSSKTASVAYAYISYFPYPKTFKVNNYLKKSFIQQEKEKERRQGQICAEQKFARAMREMKDDEIRESAFKYDNKKIVNCFVINVHYHSCFFSASRKQLKNCSPEIRELERQIRRSYYAKTLYAQRLEGDALKMEEKTRDYDQYLIMMEKLEKFDQDERDKEQAMFLKKKEYLSELKTQMDNVGHNQAAKLDELAQDKEMIDEIIATIKQEEIDDLREKVDKMKLYQSEIQHFLHARDSYRAGELERDIYEERQRMKHVAEKEAQMAEFQKAKEAESAAKADIVAKAIERMMKDQFKREELEELRQELLEEELKAENRQKDLDEIAKKQRQVEELRKAAEEAIKLREEKKAAEKKEEEEYRKQLMAKFAEDDKLELMGDHKRRMRERQHGRQVEQMIAERRCLRAQEKERDQHVLECFNLEEQRRQALIDQERLKLLKEHGPNIIGFIPRNVIKSQKELEALGEPFLSYYRNPELEPHPMTVDLEPCEQEIFKNMPVPRNIRY